MAVEAFGSWNDHTRTVECRSREAVFTTARRDLLYFRRRWFSAFMPQGLEPPDDHPINSKTH